mgnify:CR=1 FL=1
MGMWDERVKVDARTAEMNARERNCHPLLLLVAVRIASAFLRTAKPANQSATKLWFELQGALAARCLSSGVQFWEPLPSGPSQKNSVQ